MLSEKALIQTAQSYVEVGKNLFQKGCMEEAISNFHKAHEFHLDCVEAYEYLARAHAKRKSWHDCIQACREVLRLKPDSAPTYLMLGDALRHVGQPDQAVQVCYQAEQQELVAPGIYRLLGGLMEGRKQDGNAVTYYRKFLKLKPDSPWGYVALARVLQKQGDFHEVNQCCNQAMKHEPVIPVIFRLKANALKRLDQMDAAIESYRRYLELEPENARGYVELGESLLKSNRHDEVIDCCFQAKQQPSVEPVIYRLLGAAFQKQGLLEGAISNYQKFLELKPDVVWVYAALGKTYQRVGDYDKAVNCFWEAEQRGHERLAMNQLIAEIYKNQNRLDDAVPFYQKVLELKSGHPDQCLQSQENSETNQVSEQEENTPEPSETMTQLSAPASGFFSRLGSLLRA